MYFKYTNSYVSKQCKLIFLNQLLVPNHGPKSLC